jgi:hypothetical protein
MNDDVSSEPVDMSEQELAEEDDELVKKHGGDYSALHGLSVGDMHQPGHREVCMLLDQSSVERRHTSDPESQSGVSRD